MYQFQATAESKFRCLATTNRRPIAHGSYLDIYFDKYVPEMTAQQLRDLLFPVLDFNARNKEEAYLDTVPAEGERGDPGSTGCWSG